MKGILISMAGIPRSLSDFLPDNGLASLASSLIEENVEVKIFDFNLPSIFSEIYSDEIKNFLKDFSYKIFMEEKKPSFFEILKLKKVSKLIEENKKKYIEKLKNFLLETIEREKIDFIGFKLWAGDGFDWSIEIGNFLKKKKPEIKIFGGGPQVDIFEHYIFEKGEFFDALCYGEGERTIKEMAKFVQGKKKLKDIPNLIYKENGKIIKTEREIIEDLNSLPVPVYEPEIYWKLENKIKMIVIDESRGCKNACFFCIHPKKSGKRREKSIERLVDEIKIFMDKYKVYLFRFAGSSTPGELMVNFAKRILEENIKINYVASGYTKEFENIDFELLKNSGCESIFWGVESANEEILKKGMNKNVTKEEMEKVLKKCKNAGIFTVASLIYPAPFENENTRKETLEFLKNVKVDSALVQFPGIYPGTVWFKEAEKFGFKIDKKTYPLKVMNYKIKALFPPRFWSSLPYKVNGMKFKEFAYETEKFQKDIKNSGINTSISNEDYLFFKFSEFQNLDDFLKYNRCYFYSGESEKLDQEIKKINENSEKLR